MGAVMEKLPHPYKLTHKITSKNERGFCVCDGFPTGGGGGENFFKICRVFFSKFSHSFTFFFPYFFSLFLHIFSQKSGVFIGG